MHNELVVIFGCQKSGECGAISTHPFAFSHDKHNFVNFVGSREKEKIEIGLGGCDFFGKRGSWLM